MIPPELHLVIVISVDQNGIKYTSLLKGKLTIYWVNNLMLEQALGLTMCFHIVLITLFIYKWHLLTIFQVSSKAIIQ